MFAEVGEIEVEGTECEEVLAFLLVLVRDCCENPSGQETLWVNKKN